ncbi:MAG TPA: enoyl-CoA hydratase-related protein [Candidatus Binatia bacterium]|nr:enoyl-CoA hydratase-related protein [Candidatus Binatia bacterium]
MKYLSLRRENGVARVILQRPDVRNAFNAELIGELRGAFEQLAGDDAVRAIVLEGAGTHFSAGADINWLRASIELTEIENEVDAAAMSTMLRTIDATPKAVIGKVHGAALGLGIGLVAVCDLAVAADDTTFGFTEVKLGIIPAVISPFAVAKIGYSHARALFLTGERFSAERAKAIGLIHATVPPVELESAVEGVLEELATAGPAAIGAAKRLLVSIRDATYDETHTITSGLIARQRVTDEAQEGLRAFLDHRRASWRI